MLSISRHEIITDYSECFPPCSRIALDRRIALGPHNALIALGIDQSEDKFDELFKQRRLAVCELYL